MRPSGVRHLSNDPTNESLLENAAYYCCHVEPHQALSLVRRRMLCPSDSTHLFPLFVSLLRKSAQQCAEGTPRQCSKALAELEDARQKVAGSPTDIFSRPDLALLALKAGKLKKAEAYCTDFDHEQAA